MTTAKKKKKSPATMRITYQTTLAIQQTAETEDPLAVSSDAAHRELIERLVEVVKLMQEKYPDREVVGAMTEQVYATEAVVL